MLHVHQCQVSRAEILVGRAGTTFLDQCHSWGLPSFDVAYPVPVVHKRQPYVSSLTLHVGCVLCGGVFGAPGLGICYVGIICVAYRSCLSLYMCCRCRAASLCHDRVNLRMHVAAGAQVFIQKANIHPIAYHLCMVAERLV